MSPKISLELHRHEIDTCNVYAYLLSSKTSVRTNHITSDVLARFASGSSPSEESTCGSPDADIANALFSVRLLYVGADTYRPKSRYQVDKPNSYLVITYTHVYYKKGILT